MGGDTEGGTMKRLKRKQLPEERKLRLYLLSRLYRKERLEFNALITALVRAVRKDEQDEVILRIGNWKGECLLSDDMAAAIRERGK